MPFPRDLNERMNMRIKQITTHARQQSATQAIANDDDLPLVIARRIFYRMHRDGYFLLLHNCQW